MASVFLSYSRDDAARAKSVAAALERLGHEVWWDNQLEGGSRFASEIEAALKRADAVVVLWSRSSLASAWVQDEAAEGRDTGRLVPVVIDGSQPPLGFRQFQAIDLTKWTGRPGAAAIKATHSAIIARAADRIDRDVAPPVPSAAPERHGRARRGSMLLAALLITLLVAGGTYWVLGNRSHDEARALRVRLDKFVSLSPDVPQTVPQVLREELLAALGTDAIIIASSSERSSERSSEDEPSAYAVNASVRTVAGALRFTVHLVDEGNGGTLWSHQFDKPLASIEVAPRQVGVAVSQVLRCGLTAKARHGRPLPDKTMSLHLAYCEEFWAETVGRRMDAMRGLDVARRVVEASPDFAPGWSGRARMASWEARSASPAAAAVLLKEAEEAARRAIELNPEMSQAYEVLAALEPRSSTEREALHKKAVSVLPGDCGCEHVGYGGFLGNVGRLRDATAEYERAHDLVPMSVTVNASLAEIFLTTGRETQARELIRTIKEVWPDDPAFGLLLMRSALWTGKYDEALAVAADPNMALSEAEQAAYSAAFRALKSGDAIARSRAAIQVAALPATTGDAKLRIAALASVGADQAALASASALVGASGSADQYVLFEPPLARARQSPAFARLLKRIGLIEYWRKTGSKPDFCSEQGAPALCGTLR